MGCQDHELACHGVQDNGGLLMTFVQTEPPDSGLASLISDRGVDLRVRGLADRGRGPSSLAANDGFGDILISRLTVGCKGCK